MIKFVNDLRQVGGVLRIIRFSLPINVTATINLKKVKEGVKHHNPNLKLYKYILIGHFLDTGIICLFVDILYSLSVTSGR